MTHEEIKAKKLVAHYLGALQNEIMFDAAIKIAKQCALVCVEEIISTLESKQWPTLQPDVRYWKSVKEAINILFIH